MHHEGLPTNASRSITIINITKQPLFSQPDKCSRELLQQYNDHVHQWPNYYSRELFQNTTIISINALTITPESFSRNTTIISLNTLTITQDALPHLYHKEENSSRTNMIVIQTYSLLWMSLNNQRVQYRCSRHSSSPAHTTDQPTWDKVGS